MNLFFLHVIFALNRPTAIEFTGKRGRTQDGGRAASGIITMNISDNVTKKDSRKVALREMIKDRLQTAKMVLAPSKTMKDIWVELTKTYYPLSYNTFLNTFNRDLNTLDLFTLIAVSRYFQIPIELILADTSLSLEDFARQANLSSHRDNGLFDPSSESAGTFYGFMNAYDQSKDGLMHFQLDIQTKGKDSSSAVLTQYGQDAELIETYRGDRFSTPDKNMIYLALSGDSGHFMTIVFNTNTFGSGGQGFCRGVIFTAGSNQSEVINCILFREPVNIDDQEDTNETAEIKEYIRGLLKISNDRSQTLTISRDDYEQLLKDNGDVQTFSDRYQSMITPKEVLSIDEGYALYRSNRQDNAQQRESVIKALLSLRRKSLLPDQIMYSEYTPYLQFGQSLKAKTIRDRLTDAAVSEKSPHLFNGRPKRMARKGPRR